MRPVGALVIIVAVLAACSDVSAPAATPDPFARLALQHALVLPAMDGWETRPGPADGFTIVAASLPIREATPYEFTLGHCGLQSPVDVGGSLWDPIDGQDADGRALDLATDGEMINATAGVIVVIGDQLRFRTDSGSVVRFARHVADETTYPLCD